MNFIIKHSTALLFSLLCLIAVSYAIFEWSSYRSRPVNTELTSLAEQSVKESKERYQEFLYDFSNRSTELTEYIRSAVINSHDPAVVFNEMASGYDFWGIMVFKEGERWLWDGFVPDEYPGELLAHNESAYMSLKNDNNVSYLFSVIPFFVRTSNSVIRYDVYTRVKLFQDNIIALGRDLELETAELFEIKDSYPVHFSFSEMRQRGALASEVLFTPSTDSVGEVYALRSDFTKYQNAYYDKVNLWRAFFFIKFIIICGFLALLFPKDVGGWPGLLIQVGSFTVFWFLIKALYPLIDTEGPVNEFLSNIQLVEYIVNSIFVLLICISVAPFLASTKKLAVLQSRRISFLSILLLAAGAYILLYQFQVMTSELVSYSDIRVMDLELLPTAETLVFYLSSSVFFISLMILFTSCIWFVLNNSTVSLWLNSLGLVAGFLLGLAIVQLHFKSPEDFRWAIIVGALLLALIAIFAVYIYKRSPLLAYSSKLRLLLFFSYLSVCFIYICFSNGNALRQNQRMLEEAKSFAVDEENEIENITRELLLTLEKQLQSMPEDMFNDTFFDNFMQNMIPSEWLRYTISVQLITQNGDRFADYTTSLSPPQWSTAFRIQELEIPFEAEQIRRSNLRPVIRSRPINTLHSDYSSFRRGWIPIFAGPGSQERVGWILCSIYKELPELDRPLRTVISYSKNQKWERTLNAIEYEDGVPVRSSFTGIPLAIPSPSILPNSVNERAKKDSLFRRSATYGGTSVKELFVRNGENRVIRIAMNKISFTQHFFSFLRLFFILVMLGVFIMLSVSWKKDWHIFGHARRFRDRLIDRFILASLVCLLALVGASYYVLDEQNAEDVQSRLFNRLDNLVQNIESDLAGDISDPSRLQEITSTLDIDAALYQNGILVNSTTAQIFAQHLLPTSVPWDVYHQITVNELNQGLKVVVLDDQEMMIGYEPWLNEDNEIAGIAAIPTFLRAPKFYERLMSTTSYLLGFYTLIFGMLMLAVGFISSQLTSPLEALRDGLKKISDGELGITLPVRSKDEIGTLTRAYNVMGKRLKDLQNELAQNEREAAWKEMAQQVAHEIKNPLTPMKLNLQHLERQLNQTGGELENGNLKISKIAKNMIEQIDSLNKIASDFSRFAKPLEEDFTEIDINEIVGSVCEIYEHDSSFELEVELDSEKLTTLGHKDEIRRVLVNLIKNAIEAIGEKAKISVTTFTDYQKTNAFIEVTDNGEGIPVEDQDKIFVPNFSTKTSGTGLGLAITKKIIEEHDGEISFISTVGQGTSFTVRIPLKKELNSPHSLH